MADSQSPVTYRVVLIPADQTVFLPEGMTGGAGCVPGFVKLTGTPGAGSWDEWGPYRCVGELTAALAALGFGVPLPGAPADSGVPSAP